MRKKIYSAWETFLMILDLAKDVGLILVAFAAAIAVLLVFAGGVEFWVGVFRGSIPWGTR